jgi:acetyl-CoA acetyltransferase
MSLTGRVAIAGIGDTDYAADYAASRDPDARRALPSESAGYAIAALRRALADAGLTKSDLDGLVVGPTLAYERTAELAGLDVRWAAQADAAHAIIEAIAAINAGLASCVALVYGNNQRTAGVQYGGPKAASGQAHRAYVYYAPWGLTSQGGLYALMANRYFQLYGIKQADYGQLAVRQRAFAARNPNAVRREVITTEDYLAAPYVVEPLRLLDYCMVNDGGVALILTSVERAAQLAKPPVIIDGVGWSDLNDGATSLAPRFRDFYHSAHRQAADQVFGMAGCGPQDIDCVQIYDSFSCHTLFALEGFGYCPEGEALSYLSTDAAPPVNTSGGHLSESYMQGWNHQVEAVRQLRGEAGDRQVRDCRRVQYICDAAGKVATLIFSAPGGAA